MFAKYLLFIKIIRPLLLTAGIAAILIVANLNVVETGYATNGNGNSLSEHVDERNPQLENLIARLQDNDAYERQRAAIALGNLDDAGAVEPLIQALRDEDRFVRIFAARSLGDLGDRRAVEALIQAMGDEALLVRCAAAKALGNIGDSKAVDPLIQAAMNGHVLLRRAAIEALGDLGDTAGVETLIEALQDEDTYIQSGASIALNNIGEPAIPALVQSLANWTTGPRIAKILTDFNWQPSTDEERVWLDVSMRDRQSLLENWTVAEQVLLHDATSDNEHRVQNAVFALIGLGQESVIKQLLVILREKGNVEMAEAFLNSGNDILSNAALEWAQSRGTTVEAKRENRVIEWGKM